LDARFWAANNHLNDFFDVEGFVSTKDRVANEPPEHCPENIATVFREGATCASVACFNAAATMFRLCVDLVTRPMLPDADADVAQPTKHQRWNLSARIGWLLQQGHLPAEMGAVLENIREDGNDGAHAGTLTKQDAEDAADFAHLLLERVYTFPERSRLAAERRESRRNP